jgi:FkbM family methyltransferase
VDPLKLLQRPEYLLRPGQPWRRVRRNSLLQRDGVRLAWGLPVTVDPASRVGADIRNLGVNDRVVPEVLYRLIDAGELAVDVGANVGQNCSIMALAATPCGRVLAFEPSPDSLRLLTRNVERWRGYELAAIVIEPRGLSCCEGTVPMYPGLDLGGYSLEPLAAPEIVEGRRAPADVGSALAVEVTRLDACLADEASVGVLKIDVEGHEASVLEGARRLLVEGRVRDVVFEDYEPQPSRAVRILESFGYTVFAIVAGPCRPLVLDLHEWTRRYADRAPNFLGTLLPARARARLARFGWRCLRVKARRRSNAG